MARKFLYLVAAITVAIITLMFALRFWAAELSAIAFEPDGKYTAPPALTRNAYAAPAMWVARPGMGTADPSRWTPPGVTAGKGPLQAAVFFIHPTSYFEKQNWNAPLADAASRKLADLFVRGMASPFNAAAQVWAPRYRQATFGAFLSDKADARPALDLAYGDVLQAFDAFIAGVPADRPIVLAGHSQGAFHLRRLLRDRIAGTPLARRVVAAYVIGWPVSLAHDLPKTGLPACTASDQPGCVMSWLTVAEPAEPEMMVKAYGRQRGLDGQSVAGTPFLCSNPLTGSRGGDAPATANAGTLVADVAAVTGTLVAGKLGARCRPDGFLSIGAPPGLALGPYVLPGNNYHLFDVTLFWANLRQDVARRLAAWQRAR